MDKGIFKFGRYDWLGDYRARSIIYQLKKKYNITDNVDPNFVIDIFHSCYLFNTAYRENADKKMVEITKEIIDDELVRQITVADDLISRVFSVNFVKALLEDEETPEELKEQIIKPPQSPQDQDSDDKIPTPSSDSTSNNDSLNDNNSGDGQDKDNDNNTNDSNGNDNGQNNTDSGNNNQSNTGFDNLPDDVKQSITKAITKAVKKATEKAKNAKVYGGLKAGVGHDVTFGELLDLSFTVDLEELLKLFNEISLDFTKSKKQSYYGSREGIKFGRNLSEVLPSSLALPDEIFWYKYSTSSISVLEKYSTEISEFILVVDKSGSMDNQKKTLWSRAVALALAKQAKKNNIKAKLMFFDNSPFEIIDLRNEFDKALKTILTLRCSGGTSINKALRKADKENMTIILITDGEDTVTYKPDNKLISVMVCGDNYSLQEISEKYLSVKPTIEGALRLFSEVT